MTREEELLQLQSLLECVEDIGLSGELLSEGGREKLPTLIVQIPTEEEGKTRTMVCNFLPLEDKVKYAKYLQMYMEAPGELTEEQAPSVMLMMHQVNQIFAVGQCFWRMEDRKKGVVSKIGVRYTLPTPIDQEVDEGCFCESMLLLADAFDFVCDMLQAAKNPQKAKEFLLDIQDLLMDALYGSSEKAEISPKGGDTMEKMKQPLPEQEVKEEEGKKELTDDELDQVSGGGPSGRHR